MICRRPQPHLAARQSWGTPGIDPGCRWQPVRAKEPDRGIDRTQRVAPSCRRRAHRVRLTVAQATIRFLANQYVERDGRRTKFFAGCFESSATAATSRAWGRPCCRTRSRRTKPVASPAQVRAGPQQAGDGAHCRCLRPADGPPAGLGRHRQCRARFHQHAHRCGAGHHQPVAGPAAAGRHLRHPRERPGAAGSWNCRPPATSPSTTRSNRCRATSTGYGGPNNCRRRCWAPCGC